VLDDWLAVLNNYLQSEDQLTKFNITHIYR